MKTLVIFDLEATCWEENHPSLGRKDSEIIEIGAVRVDKNTGKILDSFQKFVRPHFHPYLSDYCKNLTSISQDDINSAELLEVVLNEFDKWLQDSDEYIMSWGQYDKNQIIMETDRKYIKNHPIISRLVNKHLNMKNQFSHVFNVKHCGLSRALKFLNMKFDGTKHRGIDDAINMAYLYENVKDKFFGKIFDND